MVEVKGKLTSHNPWTGKRWREDVNYLFKHTVIARSYKKYITLPWISRKKIYGMSRSVKKMIVFKITRPIQALLVFFWQISRDILIKSGFLRKSYFIFFKVDPRVQWTSYLLFIDCLHDAVKQNKSCRKGRQSSKGKPV